VNGSDAVAKVAELAPDVVLMDIRMPQLGGIEATRRITEAAGTAVKGSRSDDFRPRRVRVRGAARGRLRFSAEGRVGS
jgi:CheY-like chemotaxis protein